ncbi:Protein stu1 [Smittium mucronatum]|uniref:Protein stu1 n=1 Tax=Smittium mucronatum TaxID=133383 RepID=A0A1R0GUW8_9FUNG|nr:Protein stu1 [Smittium mucronatum]
MDYNRIGNSQDLQEKLLPLISTLQKDESEDTWLQLETATKNFTSLVNAGACNYPITLSKVKEIHESLGHSIHTERTRLSGATVEFLDALAKNSGLDFQPLSSLFINDLVKLCARTNKVFTVRGVRCLESIFIYSRCFEHIPLICEYSSKDPSKFLRRNVSKVLLTIVESDRVKDFSDSKRKDDQGLKPYFDILNTTISLLNIDADVDVRTNAKSIFYSFSKRFPENRDALISKLDPVAKKYLKIQSSSKVDNPSKSFSKISISSQNITSKIPNSRIGILNSIRSKSNLESTTLLKEIPIDKSTSKDQEIQQSGDEIKIYKPQPVRRIAASNPGEDLDSKSNPSFEMKNNLTAVRREPVRLKTLFNQSIVFNDPNGPEHVSKTTPKVISVDNVNDNTPLASISNPSIGSKSEASIESKTETLSCDVDIEGSISNNKVEEGQLHTLDTTSNKFFDYAPVSSLNQEVSVNTAKAGPLPINADKKNLSSFGFKDSTLMPRKRSIDESFDSNQNSKNFKLFTGRIHSVRARKLPVFGRSLQPVYISPRAQKLLPKKLAPLAPEIVPEIESIKAKNRNREIRRLTIIRARQLAGVKTRKSSMTGLVLNSYRDSILPSMSDRISKQSVAKKSNSIEAHKSIPRNPIPSSVSRKNRKNVDLSVPSYLRPTASSTGRNKELKPYLGHSSNIASQKKMISKRKADLEPSANIDQENSSINANSLVNKAKPATIDLLQNQMDVILPSENKKIEINNEGQLTELAAQIEHEISTPDGNSSPQIRENHDSQTIKSGSDLEIYNNAQTDIPLNSISSFPTHGQDSDDRSIILLDKIDDNNFIPNTEPADHINELTSDIKKTSNYEESNILEFTSKIIDSQSILNLSEKIDEINNFTNQVDKDTDESTCNGSESSQFSNEEKMEHIQQPIDDGDNLNASETSFLLPVVNSGIL